MSVVIHIGDCREVLAGLPNESVHCVVTSPPYWGLRDYGIDSQLGLEPTPEEYVANMVKVFRDVRRVLRDDGTLWLNLGDSYAAAAGSGQGKNGAVVDRSASRLGVRESRFDRSKAKGLKPKDLVGIPWRVAFALQADGWWLRQDIIWAKPNPMPESVRDRCTKAHEYVFLLSKSKRYYYDSEAIAEPTIAPRTRSDHMATARGKADPDGSWMDGIACAGAGTSRNRRTVWTIATQPYSGAHFATFPPALIEPCILAGTSARGVCPECGAPWERVIKAEGPDGRRGEMKGRRAYDDNGNPLMGDNMIDHGVRGSWNSGGEVLKKITTGWRPTCDHAHEPGPATVLDPFGGAGTTGLVADRLGRNAILIELSADYAEIARKRIRNDAPMFAHVEIAP